MIGFDSLMEKLQELIRKHGVKAVYLETETLSVAQAQRFEKAFAAAGAEALLTPELDRAVRSLRMIKSPEEIRKIEASQAITDAAFEHILPSSGKGSPSRGLALEIEFFMRHQGAENVAFDLIVAAREKRLSVPCRSL